jgi:hypothetical protein
VSVVLEGTVVCDCEEVVVTRGAEVFSCEVLAVPAAADTVRVIVTTGTGSMLVGVAKTTTVSVTVTTSRADFEATIVVEVEESVAGAVVQAFECSMLYTATMKIAMATVMRSTPAMMARRFLLRAGLLAASWASMPLRVFEVSNARRLLFNAVS